MERKPVVGLAGTLDTKGVEYEFVKECILKSGCDVLMIDTGVLGEPYFTPDISATTVAQAAGINLQDLRFGTEGSDKRSYANQMMSKGLTSILKSLVASDKIDCVCGMGGTGGTDLISAAMRELPIGFPKILVSTMASNNTKPYVGNSDMIMMNAVTDIAGLNRISKMVLINAAHAASGMARDYIETKKCNESSKPLVAITMFGITTPGVMKMREILESMDFEVIIFHAVGEGAGMEELIEGGIIDSVIDFTLPEILNYKLGGIFSAGPNRMNAAMNKGIPQVVVPGAIEVFNFGAFSTIPAEYNTPERHVLIHNPNITNLKAITEELVELGQYVVDHVNNATGPVAVALPLQGVDKLMAVGGPWEGSEYLDSLFDTIRNGLNNEIELLEMNNNINDPEFAEAVVDLFFKQWDKRKVKELVNV